ncbi:MAG: TDT family transporter [Chloroflexales bacterium]|nr:TDT family transporter [Chloroflexales bacterium]
MAARRVATRGRTLSIYALLRVPPQLFAIPMGLAGLAGTWRTAAARVGAPAAFANLIYLLAAGVLALLGVALVAKLARRPQRVRNELAHPVVAPFYVLLPISGMLLALGLAPYARPLAAVLFCACFAGAWLFGAWLAGQWIVRPLDACSIHPGYFLPTVGTGMIGAEGNAQLGAPALGWLSFGAATVCWMLFGSVIMYRLLVGPPLPAALTPTLAILLTPPALAGNAYFGLNGGRIDTLAYLLAGYVAFMVLVQLRFLPLYRAAPFAPSFWSFTFPCAALVGYTHRWLALLKPGGASIMAWALLMLLTGLVGAIAWRSAVALRRGDFLPRVAARADNGIMETRQTRSTEKRS